MAKIKVIKPEIDKIFECEVCMVFSGGIFLSVMDKLKILILSASLPKYKLDTKTNSFKHKTEEGASIKKGDVLKVKIVGSKYSKKNFSTFGTIVE